MPDSASNLIRDTLAYLKDPLLPKQVIFASAEDCALFQRKPESKRPVLPPLPALPPAPPVYKEKPALPKQVEKTPEPAPKVIAVKEEKPAPIENLSPIIKTLQRIAPHIKLTDEVPDDAEAKRVASAWKEKITDAEVVLIACDTQEDTLELLKGLAKAIDKNLAKSKVITADRLEREKRWDLFLQKNALRLVIISDGMQKFPELMRHYKSTPASAQFFLDQTPLLPLSSALVYKSLEHKALLWKTLCQMLKK
jgi:hypothetical protein